MSYPTQGTTPARHLPTGMWADVLDVLHTHGLDPEPHLIITALYEVLLVTPVDRGGRLRPDGTLDLD